jgi:catechol 2,3-dioxygenase-like lactoylglutathione lyase family enzyme
MTAFTYDHIHLRSPDVEATARWYERMFGAEIIRSVQSDGKPRLDLNLGGVAVFIAQVPPEQAVADPPKPPYLGLEHIGLRVGDRRCRRGAEEQGCRIHGGTQDDPAGCAHRLFARPAERPYRAAGPGRRLTLAGQFRVAVVLRPLDMVD